MADTFAESEHKRGNERDERVPHHEVELIKYRSNRTPLVFHLLNGDQLEGAVRWFDNAAIRIIQADRIEVTIFRHAIAYYKVRSYQIKPDPDSL